MFRAERIDCALRERVFNLGLGAQTHSWRGIMLSAGSGTVRTQTDSMALGENSVTWVPWTSDMRLRIDAGSAGWHFSIGADLVAAAIGQGSGASELRVLSERPSTVTLKDGIAIEAAKRAFETVVDEAQSRKVGGTNMVEAQLRTVLVILMRHLSEPEMFGKGAGRTARNLHLFRQLIEAHFRERWPVSRYAAAVGISPDRLHDLCTRHLHKNPKRLVSERVWQEARQLLTNTALTVDQIATHLGYRDTAHFSRAFKSESGAAPTRYRKSALEGMVAHARKPDFSDQP